MLDSGKFASIVIFDSGIGGLTILDSVLKKMPACSVLYFADSLYFPYGNKDSEFIINRTSQIISYLTSHHAVGLAVLACNTATTYAIQTLRHTFPDLPFVGTEPAIALAKRITRKGRVGVIATSGTLRTQRYQDLVEKCSEDGSCCVFSHPCPGLVMIIEKTTPHYRESIELLLEQNLSPLLKEDIDVLVLGCTHYSIIKAEIQDFVGQSITVIDSPDAIADRCYYMVEKNNIPVQNKKSVVFLSSEKPTVPDHIIALYQKFDIDFKECSLPYLL